MGINVATIWTVLALLCLALQAAVVVWWCGHDRA
jgi:hypothetical protein